MRVGNDSGSSQPIEIQESSAADEVQATTDQSQVKDSGAELENMKDPRWNRPDAGQLAEHELSGSLMAAQLNSQLAADKKGNSETESTPAKPRSLPEIASDPNTGFEEKLAQSLYSAGSTVRDYASAIWEVVKKETE